MSQVVEAYAAGDRGARNASTPRSRDELDERAQALNRMMVREDGLVDGLRRPLGRLDHSRRSPGAGIGLSIVAAIARRHGASLVLADASPGLSVDLSAPASA